LSKPGPAATDDGVRSLHHALDAQYDPQTGPLWFVEDGWQQGRGAYGGLVIGAMVRAAVKACGDDGRRVRSVTAELLGPVLVAPARLVVEPLRRGSGVTGVRVRLVQADHPSHIPEELCQAVVLLAKDRPGTPSWNHMPAPTMPDWRQVPVVPLQAPLAPVFTEHFEFRVTGTLPFGSASAATTQGFVRPHVRGPVDAAVVAACADAYWPAAFATFAEPRPMATVTYALELYDVDLDPEEPLFHDARSDVAVGGYATEHRALWTPSGQLVAQNQQVFAIIR
jgi:acyl-CoA thioesterase